MRYYPIFVDLARRACVVVGGGRIAERKVLGLLDARARVTLISPRITSRLSELAGAGTIDYMNRRYAPGDLAGYELAFVATNDPEVAGSVFQEGRRRGVWVNAADDPIHCDFTLPAVLRRGGLTVAVSSGGASPAVSRAVREELERCLPPGYGVLLEVAAEVRDALKRTGETADADAWHRALQGDVREFAARGERTRAKASLLEALGRKQ